MLSYLSTLNYMLARNTSALTRGSKQQSNSTTNFDEMLH